MAEAAAPARRALDALLAAVGADPAHVDDIADYLCSLAEDAAAGSDETEALVEQARALLAETAPGFSGLAEDEQTDAVLRFFDGACATAAAATSSAERGAGFGSGSSGSGSGGQGPAASGSGACGSGDAAEDGDVSASALVASLRRLELEAQAAAASGPQRSGSGRLARASSCGGGGSGSDGGEAEAAPSLENADPRALAALRELCSGAASDEFLAHVLVQRCDGDAEAAAIWLVEQECVAEAEAEWRQRHEEERAKAERAERERQKGKAAILSRFALQAVAEPGAGKKEKPVEAWSTGKQQKQPTSKVRYRDGAVATSSGEKYITIKPPEWDGGSKGKVYTKGKRGKGFV